MPGPIQSIERSAAILRLLAAGPGPLRVGEVAASLGLPKTTAHGILRTLVRVGFLEHDPATRRYRLGSALLHLGTAPLDVNELRSRAINWADSLAARSGEAVRVGTLHAGQVLVVHHVFSPDDSAQTLQVGALLPPHATSIGKVLLAYDAGAASVAARVELTAYTRRTIHTARGLTGALEETREQGWGLEIEEFEPGRAGIAAPIRTFGGLVVSAIGISGTVERICDGRLRPRPPLVTMVRNAARAISRDLLGSRP